MTPKEIDAMVAAKYPDALRSPLAQAVRDITGDDSNIAALHAADCIQTCEASGISYDEETISHNIESNFPDLGIDECDEIARAAVPPAPTLPTPPANGWGSVIWDGTRTQVTCHGRPACENMPDYVSMQFGANALSASACLTPADARLVAAMLLQAADKAEGR